MKPRKETRRIIWHTTATLPGQDVTYDDLWQWHVVQNGWSHIGYHYLIGLDGSVIPCRPETLQGAHCYGENHDSIGISYAGGLDNHRNPKDTRSKAQVEAMYKLTERLCNKYGLGWEHVSGHNQYAAVACPCFNVPKDINQKIYTVQSPSIEPNLSDLGAIGAVVAELAKQVASLQKDVAELKRAQNNVGR